MMAEAVYVLSALTSLFCAYLLFRSYRAKKSKLLLWSMLCFLGLAANSVIVFVDLAVLPDVDLRLVRASIAYVSVLLLVVGLVRESR